MTKLIKLVFAFGLILTLGACSSTKTTESEESVDPALAATPLDAGTDAVPLATTENAADPSLDPNSALPAEPDTGLVQAQPPVDAPQDAVPPATPTEHAAGTPPSDNGSGQFENVTVQSGDTLMKVAFETYGDLYRWKSILEANKDRISDPNHIPAGTVLKVERPATHVAIERNGEKYLIKNGDTLGTISNDVYGTQSKWKVLWENNKQMIHDPNKIFAGFYLYYQPDHSAPPAENPNMNQQPLATTDAAAPAPEPTLAVPTQGENAARAPAAADTPAADQTVTQ